MDKVIKGDCLKAMRKMLDNSIDTIITDPPYGLKFMNKKWDYDVPSVETWQECLRVLKPGGTALIFAGTRTQHRMACNVEDAGFILKDVIMWLYGSGFPKSKDIGKQVKQFNGWKSHGLKPAYEPILVCMKPNEGSNVENALKWGVAGLNIDGGRVKTTHNVGRYPSNIIHDGSDEVLELFPDSKTGNIKPFKQKTENGGYKKMGEYRNCNFTGDKGSAARFFYCAKVSKKERNIGCENLEEKRPDKRSKKGMGTFEEKGVQPSSNHHPCVKPLSLMKYLCTLTETPTKGIVLDPFAGSCSTALACIATKRPYIMIEQDAEYVKIGKARIKKFRDDSETLWDVL